MARVQGRSPAKQSLEVRLAEVAVRQTWAQTVQYGVIGVCVLLSIWLLWPIADSLAGQKTVVDVKLVGSLTFAFSVSGLAGGAWVVRLRRRLRDAENRNRHLSRDVKELQQRLKDHGLPTEVTRG